MSVSFCLPHPVAVNVFIIYRDLCACTVNVCTVNVCTVCEFWV